MKIDEFMRLIKSESDAFERYVDGHKVLRAADISADDWFDRLCEYVVLPEEIVARPEHSPDV